MFCLKRATMWKKHSFQTPELDSCLQHLHAATPCCHRCLRWNWGKAPTVWLHCSLMCYLAWMQLWAMWMYWQAGLFHQHERNSRTVNFLIPEPESYVFEWSHISMHSNIIFFLPLSLPFSIPLNHCLCVFLKKCKTSSQRCKMTIKRCKAMHATINRHATTTGLWSDEKQTQNDD